MGISCGDKCLLGPHDAGHASVATGFGVLKMPSQPICLSEAFRMLGHVVVATRRRELRLYSSKIGACAFPIKIHLKMDLTPFHPQLLLLVHDLDK